MPTIKSLKPIVDHMKNVDQYLHIIANMDGEMTFKVETELITLLAFFDKLEHPIIDNRPPLPRSKAIRAAVKVDIKKFAKFLHCYLVEPENVVCCLGKNQAVVLHAIAPDGLYLTYYLPNIAD